jgi:hypothetical protein
VTRAERGSRKTPALDIWLPTFGAMPTMSAGYFFGP